MSTHRADPETRDLGVSFVILNWNGRRLLAECLPSILEAARRYEGPTQVLVVDNGSTDDSISFVKDAFPSVDVLALTRNTGFPEGCNHGVRAAVHPLVFLLNNDVAVEPDVLAPLVSVLTGTSDAFAVSPRINEWQREQLQCSAIAGVLEGGHLVQEWAVDAQAGDLCGVRTPTLYTSGAAMLFWRYRFEALGGFDTLFEPFYWEDTDLSYRAWKRGWSSWYEPATRVYHKGSASMGVSQRKGFFLRRNRYLFHWRNLTDFGAVAAHLLTLPVHIIRSARSISDQIGTSRGRAILAEMSSMAAAIPFLGMIWSRRRADRPLNRLTDAEVLYRSHWARALSPAPTTKVRYR